VLTSETIDVTMEYGKANLGLSLLNWNKSRQYHGKWDVCKACSQVARFPTSSSAFTFCETDPWGRQVLQHRHSYEYSKMSHHKCWL